METDLRFEFPIPDYPSVKLYKKNHFFLRKSFFLPKKSNKNLFEKTDYKFKFLDSDYPLVKFYEK